MQCFGDAVHYCTVPFGRVIEKTDRHNQLSRDPRRPGVYHLVCCLVAEPLAIGDCEGRGILGVVACKVVGVLADHVTAVQVLVAQVKHISVCRGEAKLPVQGGEAGGRGGVEREEPQVQMGESYSHPIL